MYTIHKNKKRNKTIKGRRTNNQATQDAPALHMRFRIQVQKTMYIICTKKTAVRLVTLQVYEPRQNVLIFPVF